MKKKHNLVMNPVISISMLIVAIIVLGVFPPLGLLLLMAAVGWQSINVGQSRAERRRRARYEDARRREQNHRDMMNALRAW